MCLKKYGETLGETGFAKEKKKLRRVYGGVSSQSRNTGTKSATIQRRIKHKENYPARSGEARRGRYIDVLRNRKEYCLWILSQLVKRMEFIAQFQRYGRDRIERYDIPIGRSRSMMKGGNCITQRRRAGVDKNRAISEDELLRRHQLYGGSGFLRSQFHTQGATIIARGSMVRW